MLSQNMNWNNFINVTTSEIADTLEEKMNRNQELFLGLSLSILEGINISDNNNTLFSFELMRTLRILTQRINNLFILRNLVILLKWSKLLVVDNLLLALNEVISESLSTISNVFNFSVTKLIIELIRQNSEDKKFFQVFLSFDDFLECLFDLVFGNG